MGVGTQPVRSSLVAALGALALLAAGVLAPAPALAAEEHCRDVRGGGGAVDWGIDGQEQLAAGYGSGYEGDPQPVFGLSGATRLEAGFKFALALMGNCTLQSWGSNGAGELGNGDQQPQEHPVAVAGLSEVKEVAVGGEHPMALLYNGTVWTWGSSELGERGNREKGGERNARQKESSYFKPRDKPAEVPGLKGVVQIAAGGTRDYALLENGEVEAWGEDNAGLLGVEEPIGEEELCYGEVHLITPVQCSTVPRIVRISGLGALTGVERIAAGEEDAYAVRDGGHEVLAWGGGSKGQLGDGLTASSASPVRVDFEPPSPIAEVAAGSQHALARLVDGEVYAWGSDLGAQLGFEASGEGNETCGHSRACSTVPAPVLSLEHVVQISAGEQHSFALKEEEDGARTLYVFGANGHYELLGLDDSALVQTYTPTPITGIGQVSEMSVSETTALVLLQGPSITPAALSLSSSQEAITARWNVAEEDFKLRARLLGTSPPKFTPFIEGSCKRGDCEATIGELKPQPYEVILRSPTEGKEGIERIRHAIATPQPPAGWPVDTVPPSMSGSPSIETGRLRAGQTLTAADGSWTNSPTEYRDEWLRCNGLGEAGVAEELGTECEDAGSGPTYTVQSRDVADSIVLMVEAKNASGASAAVSAPSVILAEGEETEPPYPEPITPPTLSGAAVEGDTLTAHQGTWEGSVTAYEEHWFYCNGRLANGIGAACRPVTAAGQPVVGETFVPEGALDEKYVEVQEHADNPGGYEVQTSQAVQIAPKVVPVSTAAPTISGSIEQGQTLTAVEGTWSHAPTAPRWQWLRCAPGGGGCTPISGATQKTYLISPEDVSHSLAVAETVENGVGRGEPADSSPTAEVPVPPAAPPEASAPPTLVGSASAQQGRSLGSHAASWSGEPKSYSYQWKRCESSGSDCHAIIGATDASYTPAAADVGKTLILRETATNAAGSGVSQSEATVPVQGAVPAATAVPYTRGNAQQGAVLTEYHGSWSDEPTLFAYQWLRCNSSGEGCTPVSGATARTYTLAEADVGHTLRVEELASNATGAGAGSDSLPTAVIAAPPPAAIAAPTLTSDGEEVGDTLSAHHGAWSGSPSATSYQWLRCEEVECAVIEGATASTYKLTAADVGYSVSVREAASNAGGWGAATSEGIAVGGSPQPFVTSVSPSHGPEEGGTEVIIRGGNFAETEGVDFGFAAASSYRIVSPSEIVAVAPPGTAGTADITVTAAEGTSAVTSACRFTYGLPPTATGIEPREGPEGGGTVLTIHGTNLAEATGVKFGASDAQSFGVVSSGTITAVAPPGKGTVGVRVLTPYGETSAGSSEQFTFLHVGSPPAISGLSVKKGPAGGGTALVISGKNFTGASEVSFGPIAGPASFTFVSSTQIDATSPPGAAGSVEVKVSAEFGTSAATSRDRFTYEKPTITAVDPSGGPKSGGTEVYVSGTGFTPGEGGTSFKFGKVEASFVECASTTECSMIAPADTHKQTVEVKARSGGKNSGKSAAAEYAYE